MATNLPGRPVIAACLSCRPPRHIPPVHFTVFLPSMAALAPGQISPQDHEGSWPAPAGRADLRNEELNAVRFGDRPSCKGYQESAYGHRRRRGPSKKMERGRWTSNEYDWHLSAFGLHQVVPLPARRGHMVTKSAKMTRWGSRQAASGGEAVLAPKFLKLFAGDGSAIATGF
jgi:hypothetical protein